MILFIAAWHLVALLALFVGWYAAIVSTGIILLLHGVYRQIERENTGWEQAKREKRSAAAKQGHVTRKARMSDERTNESDRDQANAGQGGWRGLESADAPNDRTLAAAVRSETREGDHE